MKEFLDGLFGFFSTSDMGRLLLLSILLVLLAILYNLSKALSLARETRKAAADVEGKKIAADQDKERGDNMILTKVLDIFAANVGELTRAIQSGFGSTPNAVADLVLPPVRTLTTNLDNYANRNLKATTDLHGDLSGQIGGLPDLFIAKLPDALRAELKPMLDMLATVKEAAIAGQVKSENAAKVAAENKAVSNEILMIVERSEQQFLTALSTLAASTTVKLSPVEAAALAQEAAATNPPGLPSGTPDPKPPTISKPSTAQTNGVHSPPKLP